MYSDSDIKFFLKEEMFTKDPSHHKYATLYASSFFRVINFTLRHFDELSENKYTCKFYLKFIKYFYKHGIYKKAMTKRLYRGYNNNWIVSESFQENAFISTSKSKEVASKFANNGKGTILTFKVSDLPDNVPFVLMDHKVAEEEEIVFLPGKIEIGKGFKARWTPNTNLEEKCKQMGGGGDDDKIDIPNLDLRGKIVVFWRSIVGRKPEVLGQYRLSKTQKGVHHDFKEQIDPRWDHFDSVKNFIPEYIDLGLVKNKSTVQKRAWWSYTVFIAIYDPVLKKVDALTYGVPDDLFGIDNKKEITNCIKSHKMLELC